MRITDKEMSLLEKYEGKEVTVHYIERWGRKRPLRGTLEETSREAVKISYLGDTEQHKRWRMGGRNNKIIFFSGENVRIISIIYGRDTPIYPPPPD